MGPAWDEEEELLRTCCQLARVRVVQPAHGGGGGKVQPVGLRGARHGGEPAVHHSKLLRERVGDGEGGGREGGHGHGRGAALHALGILREAIHGGGVLGGGVRRRREGRQEGKGEGNRVDVRVVGRAQLRCVERERCSA